MPHLQRFTPHVQSYMESLANIRRKIDALDARMVKLLAEREIGRAHV